MYECIFTKQNMDGIFGDFGLFRTHYLSIPLQAATPVGLSVGDVLSQEAHRQGSKGINHRVLLDKGRGQADEDHGDHNKCLPEDGHALFLQPHGGNAQGIRHMQGGTHVGAGVKGIKEGHALSQEIISGEFHRPQVLPVGEDDVNGHGNHLRNDDEDLEFFEAVHIVQREVTQGNHDQRVPEHIGDDKSLAEGNHIIQPAMDYMAALCGDQIFREEVEREIPNPAQQKLEVGKLRVIYFGQAKFSVINHRLSHLQVPPWEYWWDNPFLECFDRGPQYAEEGRRRSRLFLSLGTGRSVGAPALWGSRGRNGWACPDSTA